ncbi:hypothetical protein HAX54_041964 [Datura stramonium]|uniref:Exocyst subunit Exo70 family protein n=1 Tax=Datura stramonium TaxID=4076 RepID=A0ABS8W111_DATST|nr:hypothetical protein [Datura stramonium]
MTVLGQKVKDMLRSILYDGDSKMRFESDMQHVLPRFIGNIDDCISSCHHSTSSATMTDEQLNFLLVNLHNLSKYLAEQKFPLVTQYEILQNVCGSIRDFHGLIVNGCVEHEIVELSQLYELDEDDQTDKGSPASSELDRDDQIDADSRLFKLAHLFLKIIPIELEIPKNRGLNVVNSPNKPVESKPLTAAKTIVGFEEALDN